MLQAGGVLSDVGELAVELVQRQRRHGLGVVQVELDLALGGQRVHHVGDGAHHVHRVEHHHGLRRIGHADGHLVAFLDADGPQRGRALVDLRHQLFVAHVAAHELIGVVLAILLANALHGLRHRALEVVQVHGDLAHPGRPRCLDSAHTNSLPPRWPGGPAARAARSAS